MKRIISLVLIATVLCISLSSCVEKAPDFSMLDTNGQRVALKDFRGKAVVLNFWASWCPPCKAEMPDFETAYKEYGDRVNFLMVNLTSGSETVSKAGSYVAECGYTFPVYFDIYGEGADAYEIESIPQTYFIDERGVIQAYATQRIDGEELHRAIKILLGELEK